MLYFRFVSGIAGWVGCWVGGVLGGWPVPRWVKGLVVYGTNDASV